MMFDDLEPQKNKSNVIELGADLSTLSVSDLDERIELLKSEIERIAAERERKSSSLNAAEAFFKN